jgi:lysophospholipase L1-like esterase
MFALRSNQRHLAFTFVLLSGFVFAQNGTGQEHWVATWATSPQQPRPVPQPARGDAAPPSPAAMLMGGFHNQTARMVVHASLGGRRVRIQLSNTFSAAPLTVGAAHIAIRSKDSAIVPDSDRALTFGGKASCVVPAGALILSDPVNLDVPPLSDLAISLYVPGETGPPTVHSVGLHTTYVTKEGDATGLTTMSNAVTTQSWYWLSGVDVLAPAEAAAIVAFGDSITDGARSTPDANQNWPSLLAQRLLSNPGTANLAVVNEGIAGNRVLRDGVGTNGLARFDRDVLSLAGVKWLIVLEGINDIRNATRENAPANDLTSSDDLIAAMRQMIERAHTHGIKVIGGTLTPYGGSMGYNADGEAFRQAVNRWIRTGGAFDAVLDFDAVARDPNDPTHLRPDRAADDFIHPNDLGYKAMADSIGLSMFGQKPESYAGIRGTTK